MANEFVIKNGFISKGDGQLENNLNVNGNFEGGGSFKKTGFVAVSTTSASTENASIMKVDATGGDSTFNLDDGVDGQRLTIYVRQGTDRVTITPVSSAGWVDWLCGGDGGQGQSLDLIYDNFAGWVILGNRGGIIT